MYRFLSLCLLTLAAATLPAETFRNPYRIPTSNNPVGVRVADLNGDGLPDIIYGDFFIQPNVVHILLAQPGGQYLEQTPLILPSQATAVCQTVDVNGDHLQDIVCPSYGTTNSLLTFFGNGDGTFQAPVESPLPNLVDAFFNNLYIFPSVDLNADGHADLIVSTAISTLILLGDGKGNFTITAELPGSYDMVGAPFVADVNGDGKLDLLLDSVYLGNGDGTFKPNPLAGAGPQCVYKDMDGDGHIDAVCGGQSSAYIYAPTQLTILHGNSDGTFNHPSVTINYGSETAPGQGYGPFLAPIAVADVNHDGILDIIGTSDDGLAVILGKPNLQFAPPVHYPVGYLFPDNGPFNTFIDVNNDGSPDIVASGPNGVYITYGHPDGTFDSASVVESGDIVAYATVADFNGDHIPDVVTTGDAAIKLRLGNGDGTFGPTSTLPNGTVDFSTPNAPSGAYLLHGDFNGDGKQDILAVGAPSSSFTNRGVYLLLGHGDATFDSPTLVPGSSSTLPSPLSTLYKSFSNETVVDLNKDGRDDILSADVGVINAFLSNGDGSFTLVQTPAPSDLPQLYTAVPPIAVADFNHDGNLDAVVGGVNSAYVLLGHGDGSFSTSATTLSIPHSIGLISSAVATGDFDGDGNSDIALVNWQTTGTALASGSVAVYVYYGKGDGTFSAPVTAGVYNQNFTSLTVADLNKDGLSDLVLHSHGTSGGYESVGVVHAKFGRTFDQLTSYTAGSGLSSVNVTDLNGDGFPDLLFANGDPILLANAYTVLLNIPNRSVSGTLTASPEPSQINTPFTLTATLSRPDGSSAALTGAITFSIDGNVVGSSPLANNGASLSITTPLSIGTHQLTAAWPGDSTYPGLVLHATHAVTGYPVTLTLTVNPNPAPVAAPVTFSAGVDAVNSSDPVPTGNFTITDNGTPIVLDVGPLAALHFTGTRGFAPGGTHTLTLNYTGDSLHSPASKSVTFVITPVPSSITLETSANSVNFHQPVTFTANVTDSLPPGYHDLLTTGTVTFSGLPGGPITLPVPSAIVGSVNPVTYTTTTLLPGSYIVTATFSGNPSLNPSASNAITQVVNSAVTTTTLTATPNPAYVTQTVTLSAAVNSPIGTPTGTIQFFDGATPLTTVPLTSGNATFATALLSPGDHSITAQYSGDVNNLPSTSSPITETILPSDFTLSIDPSSLTLITGHHTTLILTATSVGSFADTIHLTIGSLPQWTTVTFTPTDLTLTPGNKATTKVYVDTDAVIGYISQTQPKRNPFSTALATTLALILLPLTNRRARRIPTLIALAITATLLIGATGCSGMYPGSTAPGTYNLQITATGKQTPITHTLNLPLTVTE